MPRMARIQVAGYPHHVVQRGNNKQVIFFDDHDRRLYLYLMRKYVKECDVEIHAYCLMANHIHLLLTPPRQDSISIAMQKLSLTYTQYVNKKYVRTGRLWECRFHSSLIQKDSYLLTACRYIERNPVRSGMVKRPEEYLWSSAGAHKICHGFNDFVKPIWGNEKEKEEYANFLNLPDDQDKIETLRCCTAKGIPLGSEDFVRMMSEKLGIGLVLRKPGRPRK